MATPEFILDLRTRIGHDLLWLPGVTGVVIDGDRVLLVRRADTGQWSLPAGILEPGEQPAVGLVREIREETGVEVEIERLVSVQALRPSTYPNGDRVQYLDLCFSCRPVRGEARVNDDETTEVGWYDLDQLPQLSARELTCLETARRPGAEPAFAVPATVLDESVGT